MNAMSESETACQACGNSLRDGARFCPRCGADRDERPAPPPGSVCAACGESALHHGRFCRACGLPVAPVAETHRPVERVKRRARGPVVALGGVVLVLAGCGVAAVIALGHRSPAPARALATAQVLARDNQRQVHMPAADPRPAATPANPVSTAIVIRKVVTKVLEETSTADVPAPAPARPPVAAQTAAPRQSPAIAGPLSTVTDYWADVRAHDFTGAYALLVPGSIGQSEAQFVADEQAANIGSAAFEGRLIDRTPASATVAVISLVTDDAQFGCRDWSGSYDLVGGDGGWLIAHADLGVQACGG